MADADKLVTWIAEGPARDERRAEPLRAVLLEHCQDQLLEPPTPDRLARIVDSGLRQAEQAQIAHVASRLSDEHVTRLETLVDLGGSARSTPVTDDGSDEDEAASEREPGEDEELDVLSAIRASPGNVSLASMLTEIRKLEATRAIGLPSDLFRGISGKVSSPPGGHKRRSSRRATYVPMIDRCGWPRWCICGSARSPTPW